MASSTIVPKVVVMQNILLYRLEAQKNDPINKSQAKNIIYTNASQANSERKSCKDVKRILNQTYDIEREDAPCESVLNTAFLEIDSDQLCPVTPDHKDGSWPSWPRTSPQEHSIQRDVWSEPGSRWPEWDPDYVGLPAECSWQKRPKQLKSLQRPQTEAGQELYSGLDYNVNFTHCSDGWPSGDVWTRNDEDIGTEGDVRDGVNMYKETYMWPQNHEPNSAISGEDGLTSYETFMLGAAAAPHSSEVDLRTSLSKCGCSEGHCMSPEERAIGIAMEIHLNALRRLWVKAQELRQQTRCSQSFACRWDLPTRDPGPSTPTTSFKRGETFVKDSFIADSLKSSDHSPRKSRERLRSRPGVIGIGMRHL